MIKRVSDVVNESTSQVNARAECLPLHGREKSCFFFLTEMYPNEGVRENSQQDQKAVKLAYKVDRLGSGELGSKFSLGTPGLTKANKQTKKEKKETHIFEVDKPSQGAQPPPHSPEPNRTQQEQSPPPHLNLGTSTLCIHGVKRLCPTAPDLLLRQRAV